MKVKGHPSRPALIPPPTVAKVLLMVYIEGNKWYCHISMTSGDLDPKIQRIFLGFYLYDLGLLAVYSRIFPHNRGIAQ